MKILATILLVLGLFTFELEINDKKFALSLAFITNIVVIILLWCNCLN